jgi:ATPase family associated with various cellular activities (AAA)/AAA+ lid domain
MANHTAATSELELNIAANCPLVYVVSPEEERVIAELERICIRNRRRLWIYSQSTGLYSISFHRVDELWPEKRNGRVQDHLKDPVSLLEAIRNRNICLSVFLLLDFQAFLPDPLVRRLLKDTARRFKEAQNTLVILSAVQELPPTLEHAVCMADFPLPAKRELSVVLDAVQKKYPQRDGTARLSGADRERLCDAGQGLTLAEFELCLVRAAVRSKGRLNASVYDDIIAGKKQIVRKSGLLEYYDTGETVEQVGGLAHLKGWLSRRRRAFVEDAGTLGLPPPKGVLLLGVQGCGKSLTAKACAALWQVPLLKLDTGKLFASQVGSSEANTRRAIRTAEALAPCILWIDEIEKALAGVGSSSYCDAGTAARVFAFLATWLQEKKAPVFVVATANSVTALPPELIRKGRWDEVFFLDLPGLGERHDIIGIHLKKRNITARNVDVGLLAELSAGFSGAEIEQAILSAAYDAFEDDRPVAEDDILKNLKASPPLSVTMAEHVQALRAWALQRARPASEDRLEEERQAWRSGAIGKVQNPKSQAPNNK